MYICMITANRGQQLPSGYTWQDLKDLIRPTATHGVWTRTPMNELYSRSQRAGQDGCVRMTKWSEAKATYREH